VLPQRKEETVHPAISYELAKAIQRDRLAKGARARFARAAQAHEQPSPVYRLLRASFGRALLDRPARPISADIRTRES
jgi:hypothetical protein